MLKKYIYLLLILPLAACITPYEIEVDEGEQLLTIEGMITSGPGPHTVKLSRSSTYGSVYEGVVLPERSASVYVRDELGEITYFVEDLNERGTYLSPDNFTAIVGRTYTLNIQLRDGDMYTSFPEKVKPAVPIENFQIQAEEIPVEGEVLNDSGAGVYVDFKDPDGENNYYFWRNDPAVYELNTRPDLYYPPKSLTPEPKPCCYTCYFEEEVGNYEVFLTNDDLFDGLNTRFKAAFIKDDGLRFISTFRVDLNQLSISADAYRYLKLVKQQIELTGSVFDPPPANIRGNMISLDNPNEIVLGFFMAAGEYKERIYINREDLQFRQPDITIADDCRIVEGATVVPPSDWQP